MGLHFKAIVVTALLVVSIHQIRFGDCCSPPSNKNNKGASTTQAPQTTTTTKSGSSDGSSGSNNTNGIVPPFTEDGNRFIPPAENVTGILRAVISNSSRTVRTELETNKADPNAIEPISGYSLLHIAIKFDNFEVVDLLLNHSAEVDAPSDFGSLTPLMMAAMVQCYQPSNLKILNRLLTARASVNTLDDYDQSAIHYGSCSLDVIKALQNNRANLLQVDANGATVLMKAALFVKEDYVERLQYLIDAGVNVMALDASGHSVLYYVVGQVQMLRHSNSPVFEDNNGAQLRTDAINMLIEEGLKVYLVDESGADLMNYLCSNYPGPELFSFVKELTGVCPRSCYYYCDNWWNGWNETEPSEPSQALIFHINRGNLSGVVATLAKGANASATDDFGEAGLFLAIRSGYAEIALKLVQAGANVNVRSVYDTNSTPLITTVSYSCWIFNATKLVQALVDAGANVNAIGGWEGYSFTALHTGGCDLAIVDILGKANANFNARAADGLTPLMWIARDMKPDYLARMKKYISYGANANLKDNNGRNVVWYVAVPWAYVYDDVTVHNETRSQNERRSRSRNQTADGGSSNGTDFGLPDWSQVDDTANRLSALEYLSAAPLSLTLNDTDSRGYSLIGVACENYIADQIFYYLLERSFCPKGCYRCSANNLINHVIRGDLTAVTAALANGSDPSSTDDFGEAVVFLAIRSAHVDIALKLIGAGANVNVRSVHDNSTPLTLTMFYSCWIFNATKLTQALVDAGADVNALAGYEGYSNTALHVGGCDLAVVDILAAAGADFNKKSADGLTPLMSIARDMKPSYVDRIKKYIDHGADVNLKDKNGRNVAWYVVVPWAYIYDDVNQQNETKARAQNPRSNGTADGSNFEFPDWSQVDDGADRLAALEYLTAAPLSLTLNVTDSRGSSLISVACDYYVDDRIFYYVLEKSFCPRSCHRCSNSNLLDHVMRGDLRAVTLALSNGADPSSTDDLGEAAIFYAIRSGYVDIALKLVEAGANVNVRSIYDTNSTPLITTMIYGCWLFNSTRLVQALVDAGADVNAIAGSDGYTYTALHMGGCDLAAVDILAEANANFNARSGNGLTPLMWIAREPRPNYVDLMKKYISHNAQVALKDNNGRNVVWYVTVPWAYVYENETVQNETRTIESRRSKAENGTTDSDFAPPDWNQVDDVANRLAILGYLTAAPYSLTLNDTDSRGSSLVSVACENYVDDKIFLYLLERSYCPRDCFRCTSSNLAGLIVYIRTLNLTGVEAALEAGADVNQIDPMSGESALHIAIRVNNLAIVEALVEAGADLTAATWWNGLTPLYQAVQDNCHSPNNTAIVSYLLSKGASLTSSGGSILHQAICNVSLLNLLLGQNPKPSLTVVDSQGATPLMVQAITPSSDYLAILRALVQAGASTTAVDQQGQNVMFYVAMPYYPYFPFFPIDDVAPDAANSPTKTRQSMPPFFPDANATSTFNSTQVKIDALNYFVGQGLTWSVTRTDGLSLVSFACQNSWDYVLVRYITTKTHCPDDCWHCWIDVGKKK